VLAGMDIMSESKKNLDVIYEEELIRLNKDPELYMTPGARRYFKRVTLGYIIGFTAVIIVIWAQANRIDYQIRENINTILKAT
jgi:hypothetical protein